MKDSPSGGVITVAAVVAAIGGSKRVTIKTGKALEKRDHALVDDSNTKVFCTSWVTWPAKLEMDTKIVPCSFSGLRFLTTTVLDLSTSASVLVYFALLQLLDPLSYMLGTSIFHPTTPLLFSAREIYVNLAVRCAKTMKVGFRIAVQNSSLFLRYEI